MEINIMDYLDDDKIKEIAEQEVRNKIREMLHTEASTERIISNLSYQFVWDFVDKQFVDSDLEKILTEKITKIITELSSFNVFKKKDAWDRQESVGQKILDQAVLDNQDIIKQKIRLFLENLDEDDNYTFGEAVKEAIVNKIMA